MTVRLLAALPAGTKVTMVNAPWRPMMATLRPGGSPIRTRHAVAFLTTDPGLPVAFCAVDRCLTPEPATTLLGDCRKCVRMLTGHGLWPL